MKVAYFDCFSGISGDMTIAALLDAGLNFDALTKALGKLKLRGYELKKTKAMRGGISGTRFECVVTGSAGHSHRSIKEIFLIIDNSSLGAKVKDSAKAIFTNIGSSEAGIHGVSKSSDLRLHELGDIDSIIDIVGAAIALDELGIEAVYSSKISLGRTFVNSKHGVLPIPAPATLELLKGVPLNISEIEAELVTPTGAGILKTLSKGFGSIPQMKISSIGYGAGTRVLETRPNMLRVLIGETQPSFIEDRIFVIETNIDDMSPQSFEYLFEKLFKEGALDVYTTTIQMKKTRPAFKLTVLAEPRLIGRISSAIFSESTAIGLRYYEADRLKLERASTSVKTKYGNITVKLSSGPEGILTASPEYDECVKLARKKKVPLKSVYDEAKRAVKI
ncbi:MAG: nickel pincer cofactor biosynthesis protein LarC [Candidatus Omnitrophota bacterium]